jgi:hypothetical protein
MYTVILDNVERKFASVIQVTQVHDMIYHEFSVSLILVMKVDVDKDILDIIVRHHVGEKSTFNGGENNFCFLFLVGSSPPVPIIVPTSPRGPSTAQTVPIGWILTIVSAFQHFIQVQVVEQRVIFN